MKNKANIFIIISITIVMLAAQYSCVFKNFEYQLQDKHYQTGGLISPDIYVIGIDEETLMEYGPWQNWGRKKTAEIIKLLNQDETMAPAVIGLDIGFFGSGDPEEDQLLVDAVSVMNNVVTTSYATFGKQVAEKEDGSFQIREGVQTYETPFDGLKEHVTYGFSNVPLDQDGIVRHTLYRISIEDETVYSFASEVYRKYMGELPYQAEFGTQKGYIPFTGYPYDYYGSETAGISFSSVLNGDIPTEYFAGSIVLIGPYSAGMMDSYMTAIQNDVAMFGVEVHANILQALLDGIEITELSLEKSLLVTGIMILIAAFGWIAGKVAIATLATTVAIIGYWYFTGDMYQKGYVFPILYPIASVLIFYVSQVAFHYVQERRAKKHLQTVFGRYVSDSVVSNIVKGGEDALKLGGQKKDIAVLFCDVRGFTPLSEGMQPEQVVEILNRYLESTTKAVFDHGGTVDKFIGDATMAVFNAPLDQNDYVLNAVRTGLDMAAASDALAEEMLKKSGRAVGLGIGINCGEAVVGNIGTSKRMEYTAIGSTVNMAARLEGRAKAGEVIISPYVYERIKDRIIVESLGKQELKGIAEPIELYKVLKVMDN